MMQSAVISIPQLGGCDDPLYIVLSKVAAVRIYAGASRKGDSNRYGVSIWMESGERMSCRTATKQDAEAVCKRLLDALNAWYSE